MSDEKKIAIIISSTRNGRVGAKIAKLVHQTLPIKTDKISTKLLDIRDFNLTLFDEPIIPEKITSTEAYENNHTRVWSQEILKYDGYVFVTAQYNWGIPASLKNALDLLFQEWGGKPALIVSYGGQGGGKSAAALMEVCKGLKMRPYPETIQLPFSVKEGFMNEAQSGHLPDDAEKLWHAELAKLKEIWPSFEQTLYT